MEDPEKKETQQAETQPPQEAEIQQPIVSPFDPSELPDFLPDMEKVEKARSKGIIRKGFWGVLYLHSKTILNTVMVVSLAGIAIGWLIGSAIVTIISLGIIAVCILLNYTVARI